MNAPGDDVLPPEPSAADASPTPRAGAEPMPGQPPLEGEPTPAEAEPPPPPPLEGDPPPAEAELPPPPPPLEGEPTPAEAEPPPPPFYQRPGFRRALVALGVLVFLFVLGLLLPSPFWRF